MSKEKIIATVILLLFAVMIASGLRECTRYVKSAKETAYKEFNAETLLKKYEYFKDVSAQLDRKTADIYVFKLKIEDLKLEYANVPRENWARDDREALNVWKSELDGLKSSYNQLAAEYNSAMSKFNYSFCNVGELPKGAEHPLPREYKPYIDK